MIFMASPLSAQNDQVRVQFGIRGGVQLTEMSFTDEVLKRNNRAGYSIGPALKFKTPIAGLGIDVAALYDQRDLKVEGKGLKQKSLLVPVNARLGASVFNMIGIFLSAGPQFSFNLGDDMLHWMDDEGNSRQFSLQNTTLSVNLGCGVTVGKHIEGAVYYNLPLGKTGDFTWNTMSQQMQNQNWEHAKTTVDAWRLCVTYYF